jgi:acetyltransferase EpsM
MEKIIIFPFSGSAIEALDCLSDDQVCTGFVSDDPQYIGKHYFGCQVFDRSIFSLEKEASVLAVNGSPTSFLKRKDIINSLELPETRFTKVIHPNAVIGKNVKVGFNVLIMAGVVITSNAIINNHVVILPNTVINHDSIIKDYTLISSNVTICGNVVIGENCYIGAASSIKNNVSIGERTLIGIGSNVIRNTEGDLIVKGNPAK